MAFINFPMEMHFSANFILFHLYIAACLFSCLYVSEVLRFFTCLISAHQAYIFKYFGKLQFGFSSQKICLLFPEYEVFLYLHFLPKTSIFFIDFLCCVEAHKLYFTCTVNVAAA